MAKSNRWVMSLKGGRIIHLWGSYADKADVIEHVCKGDSRGWKIAKVPKRAYHENDDRLKPNE